MLDRTDFESWQTTYYVCYCLGKDIGENFMKSLKKEHFSDGKVQMLLLEEPRGAVQQGPVMLEDIPKDIYSRINSYTVAKGHLGDIKVKMILEGRKLWFKDVRAKILMRIFKGRPISENNASGNGFVAGECREDRTVEALSIWPKRLQDSDYFKDKMLLMQAQESGAVLDEEQSLFLAGEQVTNIDDNVDDSPENDWDSMWTMYLKLMNVMHSTLMLTRNEYHEVHEMQTDEQHNYVVDSYTDYTSNSNTIPYDQYMEDNEDHVVQRDVSSVRNDALMSNSR
ncbi:hypothetical protein Tco_0566090 [Tanacetum coccineum]